MILPQVCSVVKLAYAMLFMNSHPPLYNKHTEWNEACWNVFQNYIYHCILDESASYKMDEIFCIFNTLSPTDVLGMSKSNKPQNPKAVSYTHLDVYKRQN